jgi:two-component system, LytTR family, sensor kinase
MYLGNPILKKRAYLVNFIIIWVIIFMTHLSILRVFYELHLFISLSDSLIFNLLFAAIAIYIWFPVRYIKTDSTFIYRVLLNHVLISAVVSGLWLTAGYYLLVFIFAEHSQYTGFLLKSLPWRFVSGILFYAGVCLFYYVLVYYKSLQERLEKETELKNQVREAEMNMLKFQLNPHFIFNSLNSISSLTIDSPEKAREMIIRLSDFLRYSLQQDGLQKSSLEKEIKNIEDYLDIEKIRFGKRLRYYKEIEDECLDLEIPNLILQPVFENAIKHGVHNSTEEVTIQLSCSIESEYLVIEVCNDFDPEFASMRGEGVGLKNIEERLKLIYKTSGLLEVRIEVNVFIVKVFIPVDNL